MEIILTMLILFCIAFLLNKIRNFEMQQNLKQEKLRNKKVEKTSEVEEKISDNKDTIINLQNELIKQLQEKLEQSKKTDEQKKEE